jgi:NAD(P)-dependent dehydrogenase (short-subunit alcohol dehydrogenase family)
LPGRTPRAYPELAAQVVVITGAAGGIGLATARAFARCGARLALLDRDAPRLEAAAGELARGGAEVVPLAASVADPRAVEDAFAVVDARLGPVDVLVGSAGIAMNRPTLELTPEDWQRAVDVNLTGAFLCTQAAGRRMVPRGRGCIVNVASMYGVVAAGSRAAYCASKAALVNLTRSLAVEWGPQGVRVNALAPGYVRTELVDALVREGRLDVDALERRTPLGRLGRPEEIAELALFLASTDAELIAGHTLVADGGWTAQGGPEAGAPPG